MTNVTATTKFIGSLRRGTLCASLRGDRVVFSGGKQGEHSIALDVSSKARIVAHWEGYCENNGVTPKPAQGARVTFQRGMFGRWPGVVVSSCVTSAVIRFTRRNGSVSSSRVSLSDVQF